MVFLNTNHEKADLLLHTVDRLILGPGTELFYVTRVNKSHLRVDQAYKKGQTSEVLIEEIAVWDSENGLTDKRSKPSIFERRKNFDQTSLRATLVIRDRDSLNHLTDFRDRHIDPMAKYNFAQTNQAIEYLNATINISITNTWGYRNKTTGQWSGMIGDLVEGRSDIAASTVIPTLDRLMVVDYLTTRTKTNARIIFQSPKLSYTDDIFVLPFTKMVWICVVITIPLLGSAFALVVFVESKTKASGTNFERQPTYGDSILLVFSAFCQQGTPENPRSIGARFVMLIAFLFLMLIYVSYSASIVALLQSPSNRIRTLEDLLNSRLELGISDEPYNRYFVPHQTDPLRVAVYKKKVLRPDNTENFVPLAIGVRKVQKGGYALFSEIGSCYNLISETFEDSEKCDLQELIYVIFLDPHFVIQKNSTYREFIKVGLLRLSDHGLQDRQYSRMFEKKPTCAGKGGKFISVGMIDVQPALFLLCWGFGIAVLIFVTEYALKKVKWSNVINRRLYKVQALLSE